MLQAVVGFGEAVSAYLVSMTVALVMLISGPLLLRLPSQLRHGWFYGLWASMFCHVLVVGPFLLVRLYEVAFWAFLTANLWLATAGRKYPKMIIEDMIRHLRDRRGPFAHRTDCQDFRANI